MHTSLLLLRKDFIIEVSSFIMASDCVFIRTTDRGAEINKQASLCLEGETYSARQPGIPKNKNRGLKKPSGVGA